MATPDPDQVVLNTLREWADRTIATTLADSPNMHARGVRYGARCVLAILDSRDLPPGQPVMMPSSLDEE